MRSACAPVLPVLAVLLFATASGSASNATVQAQGLQGRISKGPCLLRVHQDRVALMWEIEAKGSCRVLYGEKGNLDMHVESLDQGVASGPGPRPLIPATAYIHKVWITGLRPGRTYTYRIVGPNLCSDTFEFRTVPAQTDEVRFVVYGDTRTNAEVHRRLVEQIMKHDLDFVVHVGDLVSRGDEYNLWEPQFFEPMKGLIERVPVYITRGNHEGRSGLYEKLLLPPGEKGDFGFDYGPLHYCGVDNVSTRADESRLVAGIARDARASTAIWKFASYHVPSVNFGAHWSNWRQGEALPAFAKAGIDFVVTGHSHQYERFHPVAPPGPGQYVTYITAGGGGAPLAPIEPTACHAYAKSIYQFCLFHIQGNMLTMDTIDVDGRVIDHLEIRKEAGRLDGEYAKSAVPMGGIQLHGLLHEAMNAALKDKPQKGRPFSLAVNFTIPKLPGEAKLTFELRGDPQSYDLPAAHTAIVPGKVRAELSATPTNVVRLKGSGRNKLLPLEPPLWLDCHYELGALRETISMPVTAKNN